MGTHDDSGVFKKDEQVEDMVLKVLTEERFSEALRELAGMR